MASLAPPLWDVTAYAYPQGCGQYGCQDITWTYAIAPSVFSTARYGAGSLQFRSSGDYCVVGSGGAEQGNSVLTRATFIAPGGTETEFIDQKTNGTPEPGSLGYNRGTVFVADNGSMATFTSSTSILDSKTCDSGHIIDPSGTLVFRDGTQYTITAGSVTKIEDANGNLTSVGATITDSINRTYQIVQNGVSDQLQYPGAGVLLT